MPAKLERCVRKVKRSGKSSDSAWAICTKSIGKNKSKSSSKKMK